VKQYFEKLKLAENPIGKRENLSVDKKAAARIIKAGTVSLGETQVIVLPWIILTVIFRLDSTILHGKKRQRKSACEHISNLTNSQKR